MSRPKYRYFMNALYNDGKSESFEIEKLNQGDAFDPNAHRNPNLAGLWLMTLEPIFKTGEMIFAKASDASSTRLVDQVRRKMELPQLQVSVMHHHVKTSNFYRDKVLEDWWAVHDQVWLLLVTIRNLQLQVPGADGKSLDVFSVKARRTSHKVWGRGEYKTQTQPPAMAPV